MNSLYVALSSDVASPEELSGTQPENFFFLEMSKSEMAGMAADSAVSLDPRDA